mmetsp:Transcript_45633/g.83563  ORF Transcript_45633/g.83563 Transcript_45633/m.83563 type:complete len:187 (+) Transcript_45633:77-637(+)
MVAMEADSCFTGRTPQTEMIVATMMPIDMSGARPEASVDDVDMCGDQGPESDIVAAECSDSEADIDGVDYESIWAGAVGGLPIAEHTRVAQECVPGRAPFSNGKYALLHSMAKHRGALLQNRLSHLADGEYNLDTDVVIPHDQRQERLAGSLAGTSADADMGDTVFRKRDVGTAKRQGRRALQEAE